MEDNYKWIDFKEWHYHKYNEYPTEEYIEMLNRQYKQTFFE